MDDSQSNNQTPKFDQEELDYLYALYKSSQAGSGVKLTKEELKKLIESEKLNYSPDKKIVAENIDDKILKLSQLITYGLVKSIFYSYEIKVGKEKWSKTDPFIKNQLIYFEFIRKYGMEPEDIKKFLAILFKKSQVNKNN